MTPSVPRVAVVVPSLRGGGLERVVRDLVLRLPARGFAPAVFGINGLGVYAESLIEAGIPVEDCRPARFRVRGVPLPLIRTLGRFDPDLVHAHSGTWYPSVVARTAVGRPPLLYTEHGRYPPEPRSRAWIERVLAAFTEDVVAVSDEVARYLQDFLSLRERPDVIPNGIDLSRFRPAADDEERREARRELGYGEDEVVAVIVARLAEVKNHRDLLAAFAAARETVPALRLLIVGQGPLEEELRALAERLAVSDHVRFAGFRTDVPRCLAASDLFVLSSTTEGLPLSVLEAMAAGLPVVAPAVGGIPDALGAPPAGALFPVGDVRRLAAELARIGRDPALRSELAERASSRRFDVEEMTDAYAALYQDVLGSAPAGATRPGRSAPARRGRTS